MNSNWLGFFIYHQNTIICGLVMCHTWPVEVRARDDWLPAHTLRMNIPCSASTTLGLYTRLVSPWPSFPGDKCQQVHIIICWQRKEGNKPSQMSQISLWQNKWHRLTQLTIVSASKRPDCTSIFRQRNGVGASTGHLTHITDVFN